MKYPQRYGIVASRFNREITDLLVEGARKAFEKKRIPRKRIDVVWVPGAFELAVAALELARSKRYRALVAVGCILEGQTPQFQFLSSATFVGLAMAGVLGRTPVTCGVITARRHAQARRRAQRNGLNRGHEAAEAAIDLARTLQAIP